MLGFEPTEPSLLVLICTPGWSSLLSFLSVGMMGTHYPTWYNSTHTTLPGITLLFHCVCWCNSFFFFLSQIVCIDACKGSINSLETRPLDMDPTCWKSPQSLPALLAQQAHSLPPQVLDTSSCFPRGESLGSGISPSLFLLSLSPSQWAWSTPGFLVTSQHLALQSGNFQEVRTRSRLLAHSKPAQKQE